MLTREELQFSNKEIINTFDIGRLVEEKHLESLSLSNENAFDKILNFFKSAPDKNKEKYYELFEDAMEEVEEIENSLPTIKTKHPVENEIPITKIFSDGLNSKLSLLKYETVVKNLIEFNDNIIHYIPYYWFIDTYLEKTRIILNKNTDNDTKSLELQKLYNLDEFIKKFKQHYGNNYKVEIDYHENDAYLISLNDLPNLMKIGIIVSFNDINKDNVFITNIDLILEDLLSANEIKQCITNIPKTIKALSGNEVEKCFNLLRKLINSFDELLETLRDVSIKNKTYKDKILSIIDYNNDNVPKIKYFYILENIVGLLETSYKNDGYELFDFVIPLFNCNTKTCNGLLSFIKTNINNLK